MKIRGVNLGNWLSLEKWMKPELFDGIDAEDELDFFSMLPREEAFSRLRKHYETYITEEDFAFMASAGVNLLRIPIPYYIYGEEDRPASIDILDRAFDWAEKYGMQILVDLHSARGGQNAFDNSGVCGLCTWHKHPDYVEETLVLLETLARHFAHRKAFWGLCPLNEPAAPHIMALNTMIYGSRYPERIAISEAVPDDFLKQFYMDVYPGCLHCRQHRASLPVRYVPCNLHQPRKGKAGCQQGDRLLPHQVRQRQAVGQHPVRRQ